jgi:cell division protein FtsQ
MLPLSEKFSARVPVFTGFPSEARILTKPDSSLLGDIRDLSIQIQADSFLMAMIDQVDITSQRTFEMVPKIGNQVIVFGDASDAAAKFRKLKLFYKKVMLQMGWSKYSIIKLQYKNQVVAKIRGKDDVSSDSLRTIQMMDIIAANAARWTEDSIHAVMQEERKENDSSMIQQSLERDDAAYSPDTNEEPKPQERSVAAPVIPKPVAPAPAKPVVKPAVRPSAKPPVKPAPPKKAAPQKPKPAAAKPKAVMPKKNDY